MAFKIINLLKIYPKILRYILKTNVLRIQNPLSSLRNHYYLPHFRHKTFSSLYSCVTS